MDTSQTNVCVFMCMRVSVCVWSLALLMFRPEVTGHTTSPDIISFFWGGGLGLEPVLDFHERLVLGVMG